MIKVQDVAYVRFSAPDLDAMEKFLTDFGLVVTARDGDVLYARGTDASPYVHVTELGDAGFHTLVRPTMYGAYHHVSIVGRDGEPTAPTVVAGPLCESSDVFTQDRESRPDPRPLARAEIGDLLCVHDVGAYGASMASNYNSMPLPAEVLVDEGRVHLVRRRQTIDGMLSDER